MSEAAGQSSRRGPLQLVLVDADPVFRLGLKVWLEQQGDFTIVAEAGTDQEALSIVRSRFSDYQAALDDPARRPSQSKSPKQDISSTLQPPIDLILLDLGLGSESNAQPAGLALCQTLKTEFPQLPVLVLSAQAEPVLQAAAARMGASAYGTRNMSVRRLAQLIRKAAAGEQLLSTPKATDENETDTSTERRTSSALAAPLIPGPLTAMRLSMRLSGTQQIDQQLREVAIAEQQTASWLQRTILSGKRRELTAARWLMSTLWRTPKFDRTRGRAGGLVTSSGLPNRDWQWWAQQSARGSIGDRTAARYLDRSTLVPGATAILDSLENRTAAPLLQQPGNIQNAVFEGVFAKLQRPLRNISEVPLEIDILRPEKKLALLYLILREFETLLSDLRASQVTAGQLPTKATQILLDLWNAANTDFYGKYYTVRVDNVEEEVVTLLQREQPVVKQQILDKIPLVPDMLSHWLYQEPLSINSNLYAAVTPEAIAYSERLLENLIIQVANAVLQPLLNRIADTEPIKQNLYASRLMSSREIERFRNDLSWRYRWDRLVNEPKAIFESRYMLFVLTPGGINQTSLYAPRRAELDQLSGIPLAVTLAMETRDAIAPRVQSVISLVGSSVVYLLTEVLGRSIGLIGRGIFQGMGSAWKGNKPAYRPRQAGQANQRAQPYDATFTENSYSQDYSEWE